MKNLFFMSRNAHLLITNCQKEDIKSTLIEWAFIKDMMCTQSKLVTNDIYEYVYDKIREDDEFKRWQSWSKVQKKIEINLIEKVDEM